LGDLTQAYEYENNEKTSKTMKMIMSTFPPKLIEISKCYIEGLNETSEDVKYLMIERSQRMNINSVTVKDLQNTLKVVLRKTEELDVKEKLGIVNFEENSILDFRKKCRSAKLRNIYFRLIHNDFFTHVKMKRNKMTDTDTCPRCGERETLKHLIWECSDAYRIWNHFNQIVKDINEEQDSVNHYEDIFQTCRNAGNNMVKIRIIQAMIQIVRPTNWSRGSVVELIKEIINKEKYNSLIYKLNKRFTNQWKKFELIT
jgi:hypothetical protein